MQKIPTLFERDPEDRRRVTRKVTPGCQWVLDGEGEATRKFDGTCFLRSGDGTWWARREVKPGKQPPENFDPEAYDETTGKTVGWEPVEQSPFAKLHAEAVEDVDPEPLVATFELCGPKVNGNPEGFNKHTLVLHGSEKLHDVPLDFDGLREWLLGHDYEGIVWHHPDDERMVKLKKRDFQ